MDSRLGAGGMATVYAATHRNGNRVAIKLLRSSFARDPEVRARFLREGYVSNAVGHPGAVKVLDDDSSEGSVFLVMELLEGESLEARRQRLGGRLPVEEVFTVADKLLDVLAAAHLHGIVHRDVKPENVFLTHKGEVKVLDFGVAQMRRAGGDKTGVGLMLGTPDFMAPEQMGGHPDEIDGRSDLWSTGATLFFLLSGQPVHKADTLRDHIIATSTKPARSLAEAAPWVPLQLVDVIDRALKLEKEDRWPDAGTMQSALRRAYESVSLGRTVPRKNSRPPRASGSGLPDFGAEDLSDQEKTQHLESRPWFADEPQPEPSSGEDRTLALPAPTSDRTIALPEQAERQRAGPTQPAPPPSMPTAHMAQAGGFVDPHMRTERQANIADLVAQASARANLPLQPPQRQPSLPEISAPGTGPRDAQAMAAADPSESPGNQRLLIVAILLFAAIVIAFAARLALELREPPQAPPGPAVTATATATPSPAALSPLPAPFVLASATPADPVPPSTATASATVSAAPDVPPRRVAPAPRRVPPPAPAGTALGSAAPTASAAPPPDPAPVPAPAPAATD